MEAGVGVRAEPRAVGTPITGPVLCAAVCKELLFIEPCTLVTMSSNVNYCHPGKTIQSNSLMSR